MRPSPYALMSSTLVLAALACSSLGGPTTADPNTLTSAAPEIATTPPEAPVDTAEAPTAEETSPSAVEPTATSELEAGAALERFWEEQFSSNAYTDPVTYTLDVNVPVLRASAPDDAPTAAFNSIVSAKVNETTTAFVNDLAAYPPDPSFAGAVGSYLSINATRFALTPRVVSLRLDEGGYVAGAAHPYSFFQTINFDLTTSRELTLADLFTPGTNYLGPISEYCIARLETTEFFGGFEVGAAPEEYNYRNWNLTDAGLLISFDPYQVGPYAAGPQEIAVPYADLASIIDPAGPAGAFVP